MTVVGCIGIALGCVLYRLAVKYGPPRGALDYSDEVWRKDTPNEDEVN